VEFNNAARGLRARGVLTETSLRALPRQVWAALAAADLTAAPLPAYRWWAEAETISRAHTIRLNVRTLDVLHVAAARILGADEFLSFDVRQRALARATGLAIGP
jgi:predicted nucleic acid-binding protein